MRRAPGIRLPEVSYFKKAKLYFQNLYSESLLFVVASDDKPWVQQYLSGPDSSISTSKNPVDDLALLAACNDTIMSFSTFSWWAGFLAGGETIYFKNAMVNVSQQHYVANFEDRFFTPDWIPMGNWLLSDGFARNLAQLSKETGFLTDI